MEWIKLIVGLLMLLFGGDYLVKGASKLARLANLSPMVIGLTIVAMGTSAPELVLSLDASFKNMPEYAIGNVIGSNIANLALVLGLSSLILPTSIIKRTIRVDWPILLIVTLIGIFLMYNGSLSVLDGIILTILLVIYNVFIVWENRRSNKKLNTYEKVPFEFKPFIFSILFFISGLAALIFGSDLFLTGAETVAKKFGISDHIIAVTLVAFGTSLPELVTSCIAAFKKEADISVGNLIGSNVFNILAVLGITATIKPIPVSNDIINNDSWWMLGIVLLLLPMFIIRNQISRIEGGILITIYFTYIYLLF